MQRYKKKVNTTKYAMFFFVFLHSIMEDIIDKAVAILRAGGTILYPTDTIWGIGCDARNKEAVERIYSIKERDHSKSMLILVDDGNMTKGNEERPTTYILPQTIWHGDMELEIADNLPASDGSLGVRMPKHFFCQEVIRRLGAPIVSTSANLSGHPSPQSYTEIEDELKKRVDYCVPPLEEFLSNETQGSRIVKIGTDGSQTIIRP